jgi:histidinol-phosphatase
MRPDEWLRLLEELGDVADAISLRRFRASDLHVESKPDTTLVTEADLAVEEAVRKLVGERHPELGVFGEEHGEKTGSSAVRLIVDPIDSTANFARGIPIFATLLAIEDDGEVVAGLVSAPALVTRWSAARGAGAFRGRERVRVSGLGVLANAQVFHGSLGGYEAIKTPPGVAALASKAHRDRGFGDFYQHVLVAEGSGEVGVDPIVSPWDIAPLQVLIEEAGGRCTSLSGERSIYAGSFVSTNGLLHDEVLAVLNAR